MGCKNHRMLPKQEELHEILMLLWNVLMGPKHHIYQLYPLF